MSTPAVAKPRRGRPKAGTENANAVAAMEWEVVRRRVAGDTYVQINADLGITNSDRIFQRAAPKLRTQAREDAYALESARLDELHAKAWAALTDQGLDGLALRVAEILRDADDGMEWDGVPERVQTVIERAYSDTLKAVPVVLGVHDRRAKLDGLTHSDRIADAQLNLDATKLELMAVALVDTLESLGLTPEQKRLAVTTWGERMELLQDGQGDEDE